MRTYASKKHSSTTRRPANKRTFFKRADNKKLPNGKHRIGDDPARVIRSILKRTGGDFSASQVRDLQKTIGNRAVVQMLSPNSKEAIHTAHTQTQKALLTIIAQIMGKSSKALEAALAQKDVVSALQCVMDPKSETKILGGDIAVILAECLGYDGNQVRKVDPGSDLAKMLKALATNFSDHLESGVAPLLYQIANGSVAAQHELYNKFLDFYQPCYDWRSSSVTRSRRKEEDEKETDCGTLNVTVTICEATIKVTIRQKISEKDDCGRVFELELKHMLELKMLMAVLELQYTEGCDDDLAKKCLDHVVADHVTCDGKLDSHAQNVLQTAVDQCVFDEIPNGNQFRQQAQTMLAKGVGEQAQKGLRGRVEEACQGLPEGKAAMLLQLVDASADHAHSPWSSHQPLAAQMQVGDACGFSPVKRERPSAEAKEILKLALESGLLTGQIERAAHHLSQDVSDVSGLPVLLLGSDGDDEPFFKPVRGFGGGDTPFFSK